MELAASPPLNAPALPQQKILDDKLAFASRKWAATCLASYLAISFRTDFDSDDAIERVAIRTDKGFASFRAHELPPHQFTFMSWLKVQPH